MDSRALGVLIIVIGLATVIGGALLMAGWLSWFGRLPGDIRYERGGTRVYVPITSMLLVSLLLTLASYAFRRLS
ncbi:MAG TPA: DUF2905 domain-containing protein [Thermomicrobiales bacterium]|nr:DUF2905 domain-containing protein [Thermomicrobiales bacterium]